MKVVTEILQDLEILKRLLKHNANLKIRINYYLTSGTFLVPDCCGDKNVVTSSLSVVKNGLVSSEHDEIVRSKSGR